jgi:hypothetical protein
VSAAFPVFLIDLDSVLIEPRGYRMAIQSTLAYFTGKMGLGDLYPGEGVIASLEAINMTCEWDITPILLTAVFEGLVRENEGLLIPADILSACDAVRMMKLNPPTLELEKVIALLAENFKPGMEFATLALELSQSDTVTPLFPHLAGQPVLTALLANTRLLNGALTTRVFQHFTLGAERYEHLTGFKRLFESESYLLKEDRVLLAEDSREALLAAWQRNQLGVAIYTARPSMPEKGGVTSYNYSPEAEVALEALKLTQIPLIGAGKMGWLASQMGLRIDQLTKPSPVQALAAITTAVTRKTESALWAAAKLNFESDKEAYRGFPTLSIHVFEDAGGNIKAVRQAAKMLEDIGVQNQVAAWGIGENPIKQQALLNAGARLVPEINQAIQLALDIEGL